MRPNILLSALGTLLFVATAAHAAGDAAAGKKKSMMCHACHGANGMSALPNAPHLAGQPEIYLLKALHDFKKGERKQENMTVVASQLSDQDIADLAAYYASFKVTVQPEK